MKAKVIMLGGAVIEIMVGIPPEEIQFLKEAAKGKQHLKYVEIRTDDGAVVVLSNGLKDAEIMGGSMITITVSAKGLEDIVACCNGLYNTVEGVTSRIQDVLKENGSSVTIPQSNGEVMILPRNILIDAVITIKEK